MPERNQSFLHIPMASKNHLQIIDDRLSNQERTTATLLEQAFRIKEDIIASLKGKQNNQTVVGVSQQLLEKHIQIITGILKQLSTDIEVLEGQVRVRDGVAAGTSFAVQSLDLKHLAGIGDLRGRVARCDASISKLAGDVSVSNSDTQKVKKEIQVVKSSLELKMKELEIKLVKLMDKIESSNSEYNSKLKTARGDQQHELQLLDFKIIAAVEEVRAQMQYQHEWVGQKLDKIEQVQGQRVDHLLNVVREKTEMTETKIRERLNQVFLKLENLEGRQRLDTESNRMKHSEPKIAAKLTKAENSIWYELESMKEEYRTGFQSIKDSISSLNEISDKKIRMDKENVQKELKELRRQIIALKNYL
ncbi:protein FAM81B [Callorhinchus milii]|nr:protein FAM81B [Callorhinchus milii]